MKNLLLTTVILIMMKCSFGQNYHELFKNSSEDNSERMKALGFLNNNPESFNENEQTITVNFEFFDLEKGFENHLLTYDTEGTLVKYRIVTSNMEVYDKYFNLCVHKQTLSELGACDYAFRDEDNTFMLTTKRADGLNVFSVDVFLN